MGDFFESYGYEENQAKGKEFNIFGIKVTLAYIGSKEITAKIESKRKQLEEKVGRELTEEEQTEIGRDIFLNDLLLSWEEGTTLKGEPFPYTKDNVLFMIENYPKFMKDCYAILTDNKQFQNKRLESKVGK